MEQPLAQPLAPSQVHQLPNQEIPESRVCFVTVGATASFRQLLEEVTDHSFQATLCRYGFSRLIVQCGPDFEWFSDRIKTTQHPGLSIEAFAFTSEMAGYLLQCRGEAGVRSAGIVISHAGSGTILDTMRVGAQLIVVPNPTLMDNHQLELAEEVAEQNWAIHGKLTQLTTAIPLAIARIAQGGLDHLPAYAEPPFPVPEAERCTLFDWAVLTCYPEEMDRQAHLSMLAQVDFEASLRKEIAAATVGSRQTNGVAMSSEEGNRMHLD